MEKQQSHFKTNLIYGLITIIPISIIIFLVVTLVEILGVVGKTLGLESKYSAGFAVLLALLVLIVIIYILGAIIRTRVGAWSFAKFEQKLLRMIPGYRIISGVLKGFVETDKSYQPAMINLFNQDVAVLGFVMEKNDNGSLTVFVPSSPIITMGNVYIVTADRVTLLDTNHIDAVTCITDWGVGTNKILAEDKQDKVEST